MLVLHDLNLACRYAHHLVAMKDGAIAAEGPARRGDHARDRRHRVRGLACQVFPDPLTGTPLVLTAPAAQRTPRDAPPAPSPAGNGAGAHAS